MSKKLIAVITASLMMACFVSLPVLAADDDDDAPKFKTKEVMTRTMTPQGFNIGFNIGEPAGAGVADHVHGHIVPRWIGDTNFMPVMGNLRVVPQALDDTAKMLRDAWEGERT